MADGSWIKCTVVGIAVALYPLSRSLEYLSQICNNFCCGMRMILKIVLIYLKGYLQIQEFITLRIPGPALTCASLQDVK